MAELISYQLEFLVNTTPKVLYSRLSSPAGLAEWFADDVNVRGDIYTFFWEDVEEKARVISRKENVFIRFAWLTADDENAFTEFRIQAEDLTGELSLVITDFSEEDDQTDSIELWGKQVSDLKHALGLLS